MENFKTDTRGNSRDTSDTSSEASPLGRKRCGWARTRTCRLANVVRCPHREGIYVRIWENGNENVIKPRRILSCRYPVNCVVVWPERYGNVTNRNGLHPTSQRHGRRAEAGGKTTEGVRPQRQLGWRTQVASRQTSPAAETPSARQGDIGGQGSVMARIAALERTSHNCNDGHQTSFRYGNQPWNGCSTSAGGFNFSTTCRNVHNYKTYEECRETRLFLGGNNRGVWWYCSSLLAGGKLAGEKLRSPNSTDQDVASPYRPLAAPETQDSMLQSMDLGAMRDVRSGSKAALTASKRHFCLARSTDINRPAWLVRFVPTTDMPLFNHLISAEQEGLGYHEI